MASATGPGLGGGWPTVVPLQPVSKLHGEICALPDLTRRFIVLINGEAHSLERLEQPVQILREELLAKGWIDPRPRKFILSDRVTHRLGL
jgi:hypothetical protein